jgi:hypothetical protein
MLRNGTELLDHADRRRHEPHHGQHQGREDEEYRGEHHPHDHADRETDDGEKAAQTNLQAVGEADRPAAHVLKGAVKHHRLADRAEHDNQ